MGIPADGAARPRPPHLLPEAFQELQAAMEELQVAEEELRSQNEALAQAHLQMEAERLRYQDLFEFAPDGYLVTDLLGVIREANRAAAQLLGISPRFLSGKPLASLIAESDVRAFRQHLLDVTKVQGRQDWEAHLRQRQGRIIAASFTVAATPALGSSPSSLRWLIRDISQRRTPDQHGQEALLETLWGGVPAGLAFVDAEGRYIRVNEAYARWNGLLPAEHLGQPAAEVTPQFWSDAKSFFRRALAGETVQDVTLPDAEPAAPRTVVSFHPVRSEGRVTGVVIVRGWT